MKIILTEEQIKRVISEKLGDMMNVHPIYHYTTSFGARQIIDTDTLLGSGDGDAWDDEKVKSSKHNKYVSFTRNRNLDLSKQTLGIGTGNLDMEIDDNEVVLDVIFVINRDKLKTRYKIEPFSYDSMLGTYDRKDNGDENEDDERPVYNQKDKELEERVLIDRISPLRPYVMDIIYTGPDKILKKKIKEYLGQPTYVGKPRVQFEKYTQWVYPSGDELKKIYLDAKEYYRNFKEFVSEVRDAKIMKVDDFNDEFIMGRTHANTQRKLSNKFSGQKETIISIFDKFKNNQKIPLPVVVVFESGNRTIVSGNMIMDISFQLGIEPKILLIKSEFDDEED